MTRNKPITIGCVGMTHLGLIHAVAFAEKGFQLICYDERHGLIQQLQSHQLPVNEPELPELVQKNTARLEFTTQLEALNSCDVIFIAYDVPTDDNGNSDLSVIHQLLKRVTPVLSNTASLVLLSQVPPGFTRQIPFPKARVFYQVETLVFGRAMERALYPERYIVGTHDTDAELPLAYQALLSAFQCPILKMRYESAELAKISINMFLVASVTTTNTLAEICENIGADWEEIAPALRLDKRIGPYAYLAPGLGLSGGNLERDLNTIIQLGQKHTTDTGVVHAALQNSKYRRDWVLRCLKENILDFIQDPILCVLGLAYKPDTHSIKNSPAIALLHELKGYVINVHDPVVSAEGITGVVQHKEVTDALKDADVVIIMTPWVDYKSVTFALLQQHMLGHTVIDPYQVLKSEAKSQKRFQYFCLGQSSIQTEKKEFEYA